MTKHSTLTLILTIVLLLQPIFLIKALALNFGNNITIFDQSSSSSYFHSGQNTGFEDQEVEPADQAGQKWDLEGMFLNNMGLTLVGGFDFINGEEGYLSGDLFIDTDLDAEYGDPAQDNDSLWLNGNQGIINNYGYDYVLDLDFTHFIYNVYAIDEQTCLQSAFYRANDGSNPWQFTPADPDTPIYSGTIEYLSGLSDQEAGFAGGTHNAFSVDLGFLPENAEFIAHFTIGCGNDNLMGNGVAHAPEPATLLLFGSGIVGLAAIRRKKTVAL